MAAKAPSPAYAKLLTDLGYDIARDLRFKLLGYHRHVCRNERCPVENIYLPVVSCGRYHPHVSAKHSGRCVARCLEKIQFVQEKAGADYLVNFDLTCPKWVSKRAMDDPDVLRHLRRAANNFLLELRERLFHDKKSRLGGIYTIHIWKTQAPLEPHLHVHLSLLNVAFNLRDKTFHRFQPRIDHLLVKGAWRASLVRFGLWDAADLTLPDCRNRYIGLREGARLIGRLDYVFRKPIKDLNRCEEFEAGYDPDWAVKVLNYTPRRIQVGFMLRLGKLGLVCRKSFSPVCPVCGQPLQKIGFVAGNLPDTPHLIRDQGGTWTEIPPP